jgi:hypothetical protein
MTAAFTSLICALPKPDLRLSAAKHGKQHASAVSWCTSAPQWRFAMKIKQWSVEQQHSTLAVAAVIFGIVPDFSIGSMHTVHNILKKRIDAGKVRNRKEGPHKSAPSWYQAEYEEDKPDPETKTTPATVDA